MPRHVQKSFLGLIVLYEGPFSSNLVFLFPLLELENVIG